MEWAYMPAAISKTIATAVNLTAKAVFLSSFVFMVEVGLSIVGFIFSLCKDTKYMAKIAILSFIKAECLYYLLTEDDAVAVFSSSHFLALPLLCSLYGGLGTL